jgi:ribonuclease HII
LNDSKKLTQTKRTKLSSELLDLANQNIISFHIAERSNLIIDSLGMYQALKDAYLEVFDKLADSSTKIICDGNLKFDTTLSYTSEPKADTKYSQVMAASIIGKVYRDKMIVKLHDQYPNYNWDNNKGYPSKDHLQALKTYGVSPLHRTSYKPIKDLLKLTDQQLTLTKEIL